jgi:hypothetical protein
MSEPNAKMPSFAVNPRFLVSSLDGGAMEMRSNRKSQREMHERDPF